MLVFQSSTASSLKAPIVIPNHLSFIDGVSGFVIGNEMGAMSIDAVLNSNAF